MSLAGKHKCRPGLAVRQAADKKQRPSTKHESEAHLAASKYIRGETSAARHLTPVEPAGIRVTNSREDVLPEALRLELQHAFQADLSAVRVHHDAAATTAAESFGARALASGAHVYFAEDAYNPHSIDGKRLIAHEVAHAIQQTARPARHADYSRRVTEVRGAGIPQCWAIPLTTTENVPDVEELLDKHSEVLPQGVEDTTSRAIRRLRMNHREAVRNNTVAGFWQDRGQYVLSEADDPILGISHTDVLNNNLVASALYDCLKKTGNYNAAAALLNQVDDLQTLFFSAETYQALIARLGDVDKLIDLLYDVWFTAPWFGYATPRFMMDRTLSYFLSPTAGLSRQTIDRERTRRLETDEANQELEKRHDFRMKQTEIYYMTVLVASQIENFRYDVLSRAARRTRSELGDEYAHRAQLKAEMTGRLGTILESENDVRRARLESFVTSSPTSDTPELGDIALETDILLTFDVINALGEMILFAQRFWRAGYDLRHEANRVGTDIESRDGDRIRRILNDEVPGFVSALNHFVMQVIARDDQQLPPPAEFNSNRRAAIRAFTRGFDDAENDVHLSSTGRLERSFVDRFFAAYPSGNEGERAFSFEVQRAEEQLSAEARPIVAWAFIIGQDLLEQAKQYDLSRDRSMVQLQRGYSGTAAASDIRDIFRIRFARKMLTVGQEAGWQGWISTAEGVLRGSEIDRDYIAFGTDWVLDEDVNPGVIRSDLSNRETISGLEPLGKDDLIDFLLAENYRQISDHINTALGAHEGEYSLTMEPVLNEAVEAARREHRPSRYVIEDFEWVRPKTMQDDRLVDDPRASVWQLIGTHPLSRRTYTREIASMPHDGYWIANLTYDRQRRKPVCVLWVIPSPVNLIERMQQIEGLNEVLVQRLHFILDPENQDEIPRIQELLALLPDLRQRIESGTGFRGEAGETGTVRLETLTVEQLQALKWDVWWDLLDFLKTSLEVSADPDFLRRLREAVTETGLPGQLEREKEDALRELRLDERKAMAHERRRHVESRLRPALSHYEERSFDRYRIPGEQRPSIERSLAGEVTELLRSLMIHFGDREEREGHTAMAVIELADTVHDKLAETDDLNVIHDWLPLIDTAVAWSQDSETGGDGDYRETFAVPEEAGNDTLFGDRVDKLEDVLTNMADVLREEILEWGLVGTKGDGTVENTGHVHPIDNESRTMARGDRFVIDGVAWEVMEVMENFRFHPAAFPLRSNLSNSGSAAASIIIINGTEYSSESGNARPDTPLMRIRRNDAVEPTVVRAVSDEEVLTRLTWAVHRQDTIAQLQSLAEGMETAATVAIDIAEFFPAAGQAVAAARLVKASVGLMENDLPRMYEDLIENPHEILERIETQLESRLSLDNLLQYLIFSNDNNIGLRIAEARPSHRVGTTSRRWRRLARKLRSLVAGVIRIFSRSQDRVQDRRQAIEHMVQNSPHAGFIVAFIADHYHEIVGIVDRIAASAHPLAAQMQDFDDARAELTPEAMKSRFDDMITKMGTVELPEDILPLEEIIHALIDVVGHRLGGKYKLGIRVLLALLDAVGATQKVVGRLSDLIEDAFERITGNSLSDTILPVWQEDIVPEIDDRLNDAQVFVADTLDEIFGAFGIDLNLAEPETNVTLTGNEFPEADPNESAPQAQPSLQDQVERSWRERGAGARMGAAQAAELLNRLPASEGEPMPRSLKTDVELRFGQDFSDVRIHNTDAINEMLTNMGANALTTGSHILMANRPVDAEMRRVLFHELAHVVQQTGVRPLGRAYRRPPRTGPRGRGVRFDPAAEAQADAAAEAAMKGDARHVRLTPNDAALQPSAVELFGIRFLRQLTEVGDIESEAAEIDASGSGNAGRLIGKDVRNAVRNVGDRLQTIFASTSVQNGLSIERRMRDKFHNKYNEIKRQLQNNQRAIDQAIEDIAIRASFIARRGRDNKPPTMGLDVDDFTRRLERYIFGKTGILLELEPNTTGRGRNERFASQSRPYDSAKIRFVYLPAIHGNSALWQDLLNDKYPNESLEEKGKKRRLIRAVLRDLGTSASVWDDDYKLSNRVYRAVAELERIRGFSRLDSSALPDRRDYLDTDASEITPGGVGNIRLHLGTYNQTGAQQSGRERESHHITQYLLVEYFHNGSSGGAEESNVDKKAFPLAREHSDAYPGLEMENGRPKKFEGPGTVEIGELEAGRGGKMPTILLATPTHRRGNLHVNPQADDFEGANVSGQGAALNHIYTRALPERMRIKEREVATGTKRYSEWQEVINGMSETEFKRHVYNAMQGTYRYMRNYMQTQLRTALKTNEKNYYNDLYATAHPQDDDNRPMTEDDMERVWGRAVEHNDRGRGSYRGMRDYGWRES